MQGVTVHRRHYFLWRPDWDHDHCEFCFRRFASAERQNFCSEGFFTEDKRWICETCYEDFKLMFDWILET